VLVDNIIIKILISEQLSQQEKQEMLNAYRDGRLKKQYKAYARAYHPDRNPDPTAELSFKELANINSILKKLEDGESLSYNDIQTMIDMVGQQKAFAIKGFKEAYEKEIGSENPSGDVFSNIDDIMTFKAEYEYLLSNSNDPQKQVKLQNFDAIIDWFKTAQQSKFSDRFNSELNKWAEYISSLGLPDDQVRNAFKRIYAIYFAEDVIMQTTDVDQFLEQYIRLTQIASTYGVSPKRVQSAQNAARKILGKIMQMRGLIKSGLKNYAYNTYEAFEKEFYGEGQPGTLSYDLLSELDTGVPLRDHVYQLFADFGAVELNYKFK
jgi:hypothetical protein